MEDLNFDGECTCYDIYWYADEDGFEGCPYCEMWQGDEVIELEPNTIITCELE